MGGYLVCLTNNLIMQGPLEVPGSWYSRDISYFDIIGWLGLEYLDQLNLQIASKGFVGDRLLTRQGKTSTTTLD